ncbi:DVU_1553 family AMP-dependent CoA ligase [Clostridium sp. JNZ X4-2]
MDCTPIEKWIMGKTKIKNKSREELKAYQLYKIKQTLYYVKEHSNFYKKYLKDISADTISSFADFENIPFTLPQQVSCNSMDFLCVPSKCISRIVTLRTSGTSGMEKRVYFTDNDLQSTVDFFCFGMKSIANENDTVLVLLPGDSYGSIGNLLKTALGALKIKCFIGGIIRDYEYTAEFIKSRGISCIVGIPIQVLKLSRIYPEIFADNIKSILLSTDYVPEILIKEITDKFHCRVFTHYGMTEMGYGGGVECEGLNGYHLREGDLYFEIIDPVSKKVLESGNQGEVVFTTLTREGMPLIRYATGDIASFKKENCRCGTFLQTMDKVIGRKDNIIKIGDNKLIYMKDLDEIILSFEKVIDYKMGIYDNKITIGINTFTEEDFHGLKDIVAEKIQTIIPGKIIVYPLKKNIEIKNSMLKRKIYDCRKKVLK